MRFTDQSDFQIRFEWGERGLLALAAAQPETYVIVDVLRFTTCVAVAVDRGAEVFPYLWKDRRAEDFARKNDALLAGSAESPYSLAVESLLAVSGGTRLVLPSPNGATLSFLAAERGVVVAGALRNAAAIGALLTARGGTVAVIAAGERWPDGSLRPAFEDLIGAGAIIAGLSGSRSPEADSAAAAYHAAAHQLEVAILDSSSGRELIERGREHDVRLATERDVSARVPILHEGRFVAAT